jgi:enterochelin esterase-like enzyme
LDVLGTPLVVLLASLALLSPIAVCLLWARIAGPQPVRTVVRTGMVIGAQVTAIALVAALINDYALFYKSWSELAAGTAQFAGFGVHEAEHLTSTSSSSSSSRRFAGRIVIGPVRGYTDSTRWSSTGRLDSVVIRGAISGLTSHAFVYLPPQYFQRTRGQYFPAVEVFTGYPGVDEYLVSRLKYQDVLQQLIKVHRASPAVLVMMRPSVTFPRDTECTDVPGGPQAQTFFGVDVPTQIGAEYRVLSSGWGAVGDSTGGYCATKLAMLNPATFRAAAEMSGYFFALRDHTTGDLWGGSSVLRNLNDMTWRLKHEPAPPVALLMGTSPSERGSDGYAQAIRFAHVVKAPMQVSVLTVPHGGHNIATWSAELPAALTWLTAHLPQAGATSVPVSPGFIDLGTAVAGTHRPASQ